MVDLVMIQNAVKAKVIEKSVQARSASSIDNALEIQAQGIGEAVKAGLEMFMAQALVNGGICTDGGPVTGATIS